MFDLFYRDKFKERKCRNLLQLHVGEGLNDIFHYHFWSVLHVFIFEMALKITLTL